MMELSSDCREILDSMNLWYCVFFFYSHAALNCGDDFFFSINMAYSVVTAHIYKKTKKKNERNIFSSGGIFLFSSLGVGTVYFSFHLFCTYLIIISILTFLVYRDHGEYRKVYSFWYGEIEI